MLAGSSLADMPVGCVDAPRVQSFQRHDCWESTDDLLIPFCPNPNQTWHGNASDQPKVYF